MKLDLIGKATFVLNGIPYLPHYNQKNMYVSPGYGKFNFTLYTDKELFDAGAKIKMEMLWDRSW